LKLIGHAPRTVEVAAACEREKCQRPEHEISPRWRGASNCRHDSCFLGSNAQ
jgi:hypothetical protein